MYGHIYTSILIVSTANKINPHRLSIEDEYSIIHIEELMPILRENIILIVKTPERNNFIARRELYTELSYV